MKIIHWISIIVVVAQSSCSLQSDNHESASSKVSISEMPIRWNYIDTIKFEILAGAAVIADTYNTKIAFIDAYTEKVFICNDDGSLINTIEESGFHDTGYGRIIGGAVFTSDSSIMLLSDIGFYEYNIYSSALISSLRHSSKISRKENGLYLSGQYAMEIFTDANHRLNRIVALIDTSTGLSITDPDWVNEVKNLRLVDFSNDTTYYAFLPYPENSIYKEASGYFSFHCPLITSNNESLAVVFPMEPDIYIFDNLNNLNAFRKIEIEQAMNTPESNPYLAGGTGIWNSLMGDRIETVFMSDSQVFLSFCEWTPKSPEISAQDLEKEQGATKHVTYTLMVVDLKTNSFTKIPIPKGYPYLLNYENGLFYFGQEYHSLPSQPDTENILVARLSTI